MGQQKPNLFTTVALFSGGLLLVSMAALLMLQAFGVVPAVSNTVYIALVLLSLGSGLLYGISRQD